MKRGVKRIISTIVFSVLILVCTMPITAAAAPASPHKFNKTPGGMVCLTIDDGYSKEDVIADLDTLRANNVHCTFFVIGCMLTKFPDVWRQAIQDGNEICYHTMTHHDISQWSNKRIQKDFERWVDTAHAVLGADYVIPKFVRLPGGFGSSKSRILRLFDSMGYKVVYWNVDTFSGAHVKHANIVNYIKKNTKSGSIILTHFRKFDSSALAQYIGWLKENFTLGTLTQAFSGATSGASPQISASAKLQPGDVKNAGSLIMRLFAGFRTP